MVVPGKRLCALIANVQADKDQVDQKSGSCRMMKRKEEWKRRENGLLVLSQER
jgi:hypothetical protein